jgi:hypothetical protein
MTFNDNLKEKISIEVIKTLVTRFESFPDDDSTNRNAPFHEAFLQAFAQKLEGKVSNIPFFISLSSWLHGLNTTLGQTFFENIAHYLCNGEKREYTSKKLGNLQITQKQKEYISTIITNLSNSTELPNLGKENKQLFQNDNKDDHLVNAIDFTADVFVEHSDEVIAIELKTVKPNSSGTMVEKQKILEGKAALYRNFPEKKISFYYGFPFDPTVDPAKEPVTSCDKNRFLRSIINISKFFDQEEILVANELWDFLSEHKNTMEKILEIINTISTTSFLEKFQLLTNNSKRTLPEYITQLQEWNLLSEKNLIENDEIIKREINQDKKLQGTYNKMAFDNKGNYNWERFDTLSRLIDLKSKEDNK